ncbi:MAG TPA: SDR family NAD(P)-dependent oxidoreductase [Bacteroidales bacterium]|nr:SDR family NAD(P)-dependent oxidoreductase [Bacteroidales bacterium]
MNDPHSNEMELKKTAVVTGATGAIGKAIVRQLAASGNYNVIMVARDESKAIRVVKDIQAKTGSLDIVYELADLSEKVSIYELASRINRPVHVLINNAAFTPQRRIENSEGIEMQFAVNVMGYFRMIDALTPQLKAGAPARIVNVASYWAGGLDLDDPEFRKRKYENDTAYRQSKQANRMLTVAFARKLMPYRITVNSCHPGDVNSALSNSLGFGGHESPDQGADTPVWLATSRETQEITGKYFEHRKEAPCSFSQDSQKVGLLYEYCSCR